MNPGTPIPKFGYVWDQRVRYRDGKTERILRHPNQVVEVVD